VIVRRARLRERPRHETAQENRAWTHSEVGAHGGLTRDHACARVRVVYKRSPRGKGSNEKTRALVCFSI